MMSYKKQSHLCGTYLIVALSSLGWSACSAESIRLPNIDESKHCPEGEIWMNGQCEPNENGDETPDAPENPNCPEGEWVDGQCVSHEGSGEPNDEPENGDLHACQPECTEGYVCVEGTCQTTDELPETESPEPLDCEPACEANQTCEDGVCIDNEEMQPVEPVAAQVHVVPADNLVLFQNTTAQLTVSLSRQPESPVILPVHSERADLGALDVEQLTFTEENWDVPQSIKIQAATTYQDDAPIPYQVLVGPSESEDASYHGLEAIAVNVMHYNQYVAKPGEILPQTLELDKTSANLYLRQVKSKNPSAAIESVVKITATLDSEATDQHILWTITNVTDDLDYTHLVDVQYGDIHAATGTPRSIQLTRREYVLNDPKHLDKKLDKARTLEISARHISGKEAIAKIELKPYLSPGFSYTYLKKIRDFKLVKPIALENMGDMPCRHYDDETTLVFNQDMMTDYVEPAMYRHTDGKLYPTRASVLAAARFLVTQFPWDISYAGQNAFTQPEGTSRPYTHSSYIWAKAYSKAKPEAEHYTLYGMNLTDTAYNSPDFTHVIEKDGIPWNCSYSEYYQTTIKDVDNRDPYNGLRCTGFVTWAMRNGQFGLADVYADTFGQIFSKDKKTGKYTSKRVYTNPEAYGHFKGGRSAGLIYAGFDEVYEKLNKLEESDFVALSDLDEQNSAKIKAGDVLWYLGYSCAEGKKCPEECTKGGGHFALVLGISYEAKKIKYFYVAEAASVGNKLSPETLTGMKNWNKPKKDAWGKTFKEGDTCRERRVIKFDKVYNYYSDQLNVPEYDGNTYQYTDMWW